MTDRLIPLYAVGAFLAFTLSQIGMVFHWNRVRGPHAIRYMFINGLGGIVTGITVLVVLVAKFLDGAWITVLLIPGLLALMYAVHRHYHHVSEEVADSTPSDLTHFRPAMVVVPGRALERSGEESDHVRFVDFTGCDRIARELRMDRAVKERMAGLRREAGSGGCHSAVAGNFGQSLTVTSPVQSLRYVVGTYRRRIPSASLQC